MKILVTGSAGFIGFHLVKKLLLNGHDVVGIDSLNSYYDVKLKNLRLDCIDSLVESEDLTGKYNFKEIDVSNYDELEKIFSFKFDCVFHLAAQAGVRYSIEQPLSYIDSNLKGFVNLLELIRRSQIKHFLFASSSSVYGLNEGIPFHESQKTDFPVSLYAATKKSNEVLAFSYSHLYKIPTTCLRFFTVYGPYGRPDMAYFSFTKDILEGNKIKAFNNGKMMRDFTHVNDVVDSLLLLTDKSPYLIKHPETSAEAPYRILNIGNNSPISLNSFIKEIEMATAKQADIEYLPMQSGDVVQTYADVSNLYDTTGFKPRISIADGINEFVAWYKEYANIIS